MYGWIAAALLAYIFSRSGNRSGNGAKITSGTAQLLANRTYRFEIAVDGDTVRRSTNPADVARALQAGLIQAGAYDVMVQPTLPLLASYSMRVQGDLPIVLGVSATQSIGGVAGQYTFLSAQEIAPAVAA